MSCSHRYRIKQNHCVLKLWSQTPNISCHQLILRLLNFIPRNQLIKFSSIIIHRSHTLPQILLSLVQQPLEIIVKKDRSYMHLHVLPSKDLTLSQPSIWVHFACFHHAVALSLNLVATKGIPLFFVPPLNSRISSTIASQSRNSLA